MLNLKPGDVGYLIHTDNKISAVISDFMDSQWSHSFIVLGTFGGYTFIVETSDVQVMISVLQPYLDDPKVKMEITSHPDMSDAERVVVVAASLKLLKQIYGYFQLLSWAVEITLLKLFKYHARHFIRWGLVCCHVVTYGYTVSERPLLKGLDPESIHTEEMYQLFKKAGFLTVYTQEAQ